MSGGNKTSFTGIGSGLYDVLVSIKEDVISDAKTTAEDIISRANHKAADIINNANLYKEQLILDTKKELALQLSENKNRVSNAVKLLLKNLKHKIENSLIKKGIREKVKAALSGPDVISAMINIVLIRAQGMNLSKNAQLQIDVPSGILQLVSSMIEDMQPSFGGHMQACVSNDCQVSVCLKDEDVVLSVDDKWLVEELVKLLNANRQSNDVLFNLISEELLL